MRHNLSITPEDLRRGCEAYERNEGRDAIYRVATFLLDQWWGRHAEMTDALAILLLIWNSAFYRYGGFSSESLERWLRENWSLIEEVHRREIATFSASDHPKIQVLFNSLLIALQTASGKQSPVAVAKALHLLGPRFFPLWDAAIAKAYGCDYSYKSAGPIYLRFCGLIREVARGLTPVVAASPKTLLKQIDEFNYARYSKQWI